MGHRHTLQPNCNLREIYGLPSGPKGGTLKKRLATHVSNEENLVRLLSCFAMGSVFTAGSMAKVLFRIWAWP